MASNERELDLLESIYRASAPPRQRDLARAIGLSLGMTNAILKRMARKGWLTIRKVNNRNIQYIVSPQGIEEIARRSYGFVRRTLRNVARYREVIEEMIGAAASRGCREVVLVGASDLDFILEHACARAGVKLRSTGSMPPEAAEPDGGVLVVVSERLPVSETEPEYALSLWRLLAARQSSG
jgi:DNA-binding MarR family transcriptional regulator